MRILVLLVSAVLMTSIAAADEACDGNGASFPLRIDAASHYPTDGNGHPFFMQGDAAWSLIGDLTIEEAFLYLEDRKSRGFNTVLVSLLEHRFSRNAPANAYGDKPFVDGGNFVSPNEAYFVQVDRVLEKACDLGFLVLLTPAYLGYGGGDDGWYREMADAGVEPLKTYGRFLGKRYGHYKNIIWVHGGDYDPADKTLVGAIATALLEEAPGALGTSHNAPETAPLDFWGRQAWIQLNNVYTYGAVRDAALREHKARRAMPFFLMESAYEFEHGADEHRVRVQAYQAILSGAFGHIFGNNPIWHFGGPGLYPQSMSWREALDSPGARSMEVLRNFLFSVKWWLLEPDDENRLLVGGDGADMNRAVGAIASNRSFAVAYMPDGNSVVFDLSSLSEGRVHAQWRDPSTGEVTVAGDSPPGVIRVKFTPPRRNQSGYPDWILELIPE